MDNPFLRRATELLRDEEAFLAIVSPEPVRYFLSKAAQKEILYDRLVFVRGTPGSGKTTLARLFEYPTVAALLRNKNLEVHRDLTKAMAECRALEDRSPIILGCRLPMETDYRDFWEFPYPDTLKMSLMQALIQARAVLSWMRNLASSNVNPQDVAIVPRADAEAATEEIGGTHGADVLNRAREVERSLYKITGALIAPPISELDPAAVNAYQPFDVIESFRVRIKSSENAEERVVYLRPLVMLDDAYVLHPKQFESMQNWLKRRELRVARWVLTRLDVLYPNEALRVVTEERSEGIQLPGVTTTRTTTHITLQGESENRSAMRKEFRKMAKDMANRYLRIMPLFNDRGHANLTNLLNTEPTMLSEGRCQELRANINSTQTRFNISASHRQALENEIKRYGATNPAVAEDIRLSMLSVLMHRSHKRAARHQKSFQFDDEVQTESTKPLTADTGVYDAARIHLLHKFDRPYYFGIDDLCDASSDNAEQFLRLAAILVENSATRIIRSKPASLDASTQHKLLRQRASEVVDQWDFPESSVARKLCDAMVKLCLEKSLEGNASLGHGANAYGIPQTEFDALHESHPDLSRVLQFGIAYNAFSVIANYSCKNQEWCLIELGGMVILKSGLTLKRGGFIEGSLEKLAGMACKATI